MVFRNCLGMMASVSMLIIGMGAATPVSVVNLSIALLGHLALAAGKLRHRPKFEAPLTAGELAAGKGPAGERSCCGARRIGRRGRLLWAQGHASGAGGDCKGSWRTTRGQLGASWGPAGSKSGANRASRGQSVRSR